ncbi:MAG TPA: hypothetical protein PL151_01685 [Phycisphaerae bacterium]|nr:hypothetical protein [Phycisphaerae bacterium]HOM51374.1 hypothetical protein [Phycisphaerae bacterium]HPP26663.1 hypothetical protein [Phycisphaerae bacterium]HPZ97380.1 hypothetical protein [Phycisphaerae bacterium]HQE26443.1 hypothetical protein [Phycisphaerae bacterium]
MLKRVWHAIAWLALANLFAVAGLVAYLFASGRLNGERMEQIAAVLRGEYPQVQVVATQPTAAPEKPQTSREELAQLEARKRLYTLISERHQRDIDDRNSLNQAIQMDVNRQLEQIEAQKQEFQKQKQQTEQQLEQSGFQQALDMFSEMDPKLAKDILITKKDADVAHLLVRMDSGKRKKIVNTCKTAQEKEWMGRILTQIGRMSDPDIMPADSAGGALAASPPAIGQN